MAKAWKQNDEDIKINNLRGVWDKCVLSCFRSCSALVLSLSFECVFTCVLLFDSTQLNHVFFCFYRCSCCYSFLYISPSTSTQMQMYYLNTFAYHMKMGILSKIGTFFNYSFAVYFVYLFESNISLILIITRFICACYRSNTLLVYRSIIMYDEFCRNIITLLTWLNTNLLTTDSDKKIEMSWFILEKCVLILMLFLIAGTYKRPSVSIWIIIRAWNCRQCKSYRMLQLAKAKPSHPIHRKAKISKRKFDGDNPCEHKVTEGLWLPGTETDWFWLS